MAATGAVTAGRWTSVRGAEGTAEYSTHENPASTTAQASRHATIRRRCNAMGLSVAVGAGSLPGGVSGTAFCGPSTARSTGAGGAVSPRIAWRSAATDCGRSPGAMAMAQSTLASMCIGTPGNRWPPPAASSGRESLTARSTAGAGSRAVSMKYTVAPSA